MQKKIGRTPVTSKPVFTFLAKLTESQKEIFESVKKQMLEEDMTLEPHQLTHNRIVMILIKNYLDNKK